MKSYLVFVWLLSSVYSEHLKFTDQSNWRSVQDRIIQLPGLEGRMPRFNMYSGYLDISESSHLHYWLNECETATTDKLIIWFNGGPGCSSMDGLLHENGPYKLGSTGNLEANPYSWNKLAHTLYIEAPIGVGFSYSTEESPVISDDTVARDNLEALRKFFVKFPQYEYHDLYISGESYAGIYVPTLVMEIINSDPDMAARIRGIAIGNGLMHKDFNDQSLIYYAYYHGLFGAVLWRDLKKYCCDENECDFSIYGGHDCSEKVSWVRHQIHNGGLNLYNLYQPCTPEESYPRLSVGLQQESGLGQKLTRDNMIEMEKMNTKLRLVPQCSNATFITRYLNRKDVQFAIHVRDTKWEVCNDKVWTNYEKNYRDMSPQIKSILSRLEDVAILLYFGDVDLACNYLGGEWFVDQLGFKIVISRRVWFVKDENDNMQIAGYFKEFHRLIFATVKGAGHMVPMDKPKESYVMLDRFLHDLIL